jgi:hypothetical protein
MTVNVKAHRRALENPMDHRDSARKSTAFHGSSARERHCRGRGTLIAGLKTIP